MKKEKDFTFYPSNYKECPICGICSFPHIHKANTNPNDFEKIDEPLQPSKEEHNKKHLVYSDGETLMPDYNCEACKRKSEPSKQEPESRLDKIEKILTMDTSEKKLTPLAIKEFLDGKPESKEDWEVRFDENFVSTPIDEKEMLCLVNPEPIRKFIHSEKEKSFDEGFNACREVIKLGK